MDRTARDHALVFDGHSWSTPSAPLTTSSILRSVSCTSETFCMAVDYTGEYVTFNGTSWSTPSDVTVFPRDGVYSVSCASATLCVVIGDYDTYLYDGTGWSEASAVDDPSGLTAVSCAATEQCP
jgi:hypothetical protein